MSEKRNGRGTLLEKQPNWCREPLPFREVLHWRPKEKPEYQEIYKRVLFTDPTAMYERGHDFINPFYRWTPIPMPFLFLKQENHCSCGCGRELTGRQTRWATKLCSYYAGEVYAIIAGSMETIDKYLGFYYGDGCIECESKSGYEVDHKWPVKFGGGGGWLSNYRRLCNKCHRHKTNKDFGWKEHKIESSQQINLLPPPTSNQ